MSTDHNALNFLTENRRSLIHYTFKMCHDKDLAEDLYQDVVESVLRYTNPQIEPALVPPYIYRSLKSAVAKHLEAEGRKWSSEEVPVEDVDLTFDQLHGDKLDVCADPYEGLAKEKMKERIPELLKNVRSKVHRELLSLILIDGVSTHTAAEMCNVKPSNARVILHHFNHNQL